MEDDEIIYNNDDEEEISSSSDSEENEESSSSSSDDEENDEENSLITIIKLLKENDRTNAVLEIKKIISSIPNKQNYIDYDFYMNDLIRELQDNINDYDPDQVYDKIEKYVKNVDKQMPKTINSLKEHDLYTYVPLPSELEKSVKSALFKIMVDFMAANQLDIDTYNNQLKKFFNNYIAKINVHKYHTTPLEMFKYNFAISLIKQINIEYFEKFKDTITPENYTDFLVVKNAPTAAPTTTVQSTINKDAYQQLFNEIIDKDYNFPSYETIRNNAITTFPNNYAKLIILMLPSVELHSESFINDALPTNNQFTTFQELYTYFLNNKPIKKFNTEQREELKQIFINCIRVGPVYAHTFLNDINNYSWEFVKNKYNLERDREDVGKGEINAELQAMIASHKKKLNNKVKEVKVHEPKEEEPMKEDENYGRKYIAGLYTNSMEIYQFMKSDNIVEYTNRIKNILLSTGFVESFNISVGDIVQIKNNNDFYKRLLTNLQLSINDKEYYKKTISGNGPLINEPINIFNEYINEFITKVEQEIKRNEGKEGKEKSGNSYKVISIDGEDAIIKNKEIEKKVWLYSIYKKEQISMQNIIQLSTVQNVKEGHIEFVLPTNILNEIYHNIKKYSKLETAVNETKIGQIFAFNSDLEQSSGVKEQSSGLYYYQLLDDDSKDEISEVLYKYKGKYVDMYEMSEITDRYNIHKLIKYKNNDKKVLILYKGREKLNFSSLLNTDNDESLYIGNIGYAWIIETIRGIQLVTTDFNEYLKKHRERLFNNAKQLGNVDEAIKKISAINDYLLDNDNQIIQQLQRLQKLRQEELVIVEGGAVEGGRDTVEQELILNFGSLDMDLYKYVIDGGINVKAICDKINIYDNNNEKYVFNNVEAFKNKLSTVPYNSSSIFPDINIIPVSDRSLFEEYDKKDIEIIISSLHYLKNLKEDEFIKELVLINSVIVELKIMKKGIVNKEIIFKLECGYLTQLQPLISTLIFKYLELPFYATSAKMDKKDIEYYPSSFKVIEEEISKIGIHSVDEQIAILYKAFKNLKKNNEIVKETDMVAEVKRELQRKEGKEGGKEVVKEGKERIKYGHVYNNKIDYEQIKRGVNYNIVNNRIIIDSSSSHYIWFDAVLLNNDTILADWINTYLNIGWGEELSISEMKTEIIKNIALFVDKFEEDYNLMKFQVDNNLVIRNVSIKITELEPGELRIVRYDEHYDYPVPYTFKNGVPVFYKCQESQINYSNKLYSMSSWFSSRMNYIPKDKWPYIIDDDDSIGFNNISKYYVDLYFSDYELFKVYKFRIGINSSRIKRYKYDEIENSYTRSEEMIKELIIKNGQGNRIKQLEEEENNVVIYVEKVPVNTTTTSTTTGKKLVPVTIGTSVQEGQLTKEAVGKFKISGEETSVFDWNPKIKRGSAERSVQSLINDWEQRKKLAKNDIRKLRRENDGTETQEEIKIINELKIYRNQLYKIILPYIERIKIEEFEIPTDFINESAIKEETRKYKECMAEKSEKSEKEKEECAGVNYKRNEIVQHLNDLKYTIIELNNKGGNDSAAINREYSEYKLKLYKELLVYEDSKKMVKIIDEYKKDENKIIKDRIESFYEILIKYDEEEMTTKKMKEMKEASGTNPFKTYYRIDYLEQKSEYISKISGIIGKSEYSYFQDIHSDVTSPFNKIELFNSMNLSNTVQVMKNKKNELLLKFMLSKGYIAVNKSDSVEFSLYNYLCGVEDYAENVYKNTKRTEPKYPDKRGSEKCRKCKLQRCECNAREARNEILKIYAITVTTENIINYLGDSYQLNSNYKSGYRLENKITREGAKETSEKEYKIVPNVRVSKIKKVPLIAESITNDNTNNSTKIARRLAFLLRIDLSEINPFLTKKSRMIAITKEDVEYFASRGSVRKEEFNKYKKAYLGQASKFKKNNNNTNREKLYALGFLSREKIDEDIRTGKFAITHNDIIKHNIAEIYETAENEIKNIWPEFNLQEYIGDKKSVVVV
jgi:hypothetical protein